MALIAELQPVALNLLSRIRVTLLGFQEAAT